MSDRLESKSFNSCVRNFGNSPAIAFNFCLGFEDLESQLNSLRLNQRLLIAVSNFHIIKKYNKPISYNKKFYISY